MHFHIQIQIFPIPHKCSMIITELVIAVIGDHCLWNSFPVIIIAVDRDPACGFCLYTVYLQNCYYNQAKQNHTCYLMLPIFVFLLHVLHFHHSFSYRIC